MCKTVLEKFQSYSPPVTNLINNFYSPPVCSSLRRKSATNKCYQPYTERFGGPCTLVK